MAAPRPATAPRSSAA
uniref:Uncharacterized protein n=1 Tax=Arundo donax TaxID=35708 RepID=A0A0A9HLL3_ARUDO